MPLKDINLILEKFNNEELDEFLQYDDEFNWDSEDEDEVLGFRVYSDDDSDLDENEWIDFFAGLSQPANKRRKTSSCSQPATPIYEAIGPSQSAAKALRRKTCKIRLGKTQCGFRITTKSIKKVDLRGRHTAESRLARKNAYLDLLANACSHPPCVRCGEKRNFTVDDTCMACGNCSLDPSIDGVPTFFDTMRVDGLYNPVFYFMERIGNWTAKCPPIPATEFQLIIRKLCKKIGDYKYFSHRAITRERIYRVVNKLYGQSKEDRHKLVFRERWVAIKYWMCQQPFFHIPDADVFLQRFNNFRPNQRCIETLRQMLIHLEEQFVPLPRKTTAGKKRDRPWEEPKKPKSDHRHNRICRDIAVLMLLAGIYPPLVVIFGRDYWRPPRTTKSRKENESRFQELLAVASRLHPDLLWPPTTLTLAEVMSWNYAQIFPERLELAQLDCLPNSLQSAIGPFSISRKHCSWV